MCCLLFWFGWLGAPCQFDIRLEALILLGRQMSSFASLTLARTRTKLIYADWHEPNYTHLKYFICNSAIGAPETHKVKLIIWNAKYCHCLRVSSRTRLVMPSPLLLVSLVAVVVVVVDNALLCKLDKIVGICIYALKGNACRRKQSQSDYDLTRIRTRYPVTYNSRTLSGV